MNNNGRTFFTELEKSEIRNPKSEFPPFVIGEVAQSHDGSLGQAHAFIDAIADAGADAVKFQTHIAAAESTPGEPWRVKFSPQDETRYDYWRRMEFSESQWLGLKKHADERGLIFMSSPFSDEAFELLHRIGMKLWKIASGEVGNLQLLLRVAQTGAPVILSSGMSNLAELDEAVEVLRANGNPFAVLQCTSEYPCPPERVGLNMLGELAARYDCPTGLSDHSGKIYAGLAAAAMGAEIIEIHVALSREMFGPDVAASVTTGELRQLVEGVREIGRMRANPVAKDAMAAEFAPLRQIFTKSICAAERLAPGTVLEARHLTVKKPGTGLPVSQLPIVIGAMIKRELKRDELVLLEDIELAAGDVSARGAPV